MRAPSFAWMKMIAVEVKSGVKWLAEAGGGRRIASKWRV
jgi:hypothetical protein